MSSAIRITLGLIWVAMITVITLPMLIVLLPFRTLRIHLTNHVGTAIGWGTMLVSGCPFTVVNRHHLVKDRPALYVGNHTSIIDALWSIWLVPAGTVGVAKKSVLYYPFWGQLWLLSGHVSIDRGNSATAQASFNRAAQFIRDEKLHLWMWPEGRRSRDGRLQPFKKGMVHMAVKTGLPVIPVVTVGAHRVWEKSTLRVRRSPVTVTFLDPIDTSEWSLSRIDDHVAEVRAMFLAALPEDQRPLDEPETT